MKYRYEFGEPDDRGHRRIRAYDGDFLVMSGVWCPRTVKITPATVVNYTWHRSVEDGHEAAEEIARWVNLLSGDNR